MKNVLLGCIFFALSIMMVEADFFAATDDPIVLKDFETEVMSPNEGYTIDWLKTAALSVQDNKASLNNDSLYVKNGDTSLRFDFDFSSLSGTLEICVFNKGKTLGAGTSERDYCVPVLGTPSHLGAWVYGDGSGVEFRGVLKYGFNSSGTGGTTAYFAYADKVDWLGWKFVQVEIPAAAKGRDDIYLYQFARAVSGSNYSKVKGTIFVDDIQAIYNGKSPLSEVPTINIISPDATNPMTKEDFKVEANIFDDKYVLDKTSIKFFLDNEEQTDFSLEDEDDGSVTLKYDDINITSGNHQLTIKASNDLEYEASQTLSFIIDFEGINITGSSDNKENYYVGDEGYYKIKLSTYLGALKYTLKATYTDCILIEDIEILDSNLTINKKESANGSIDIDISGMNNNEMPDSDFITIIYTIQKMGDGNLINIVASALTTEEGVAYESKVESYSKPISYKYTISASEFIEGEEGTINVLEDDDFIDQASVFVVQESLTEIGKTTNGILITEALSSIKSGTTVKIYAVKDGLYSNTITITIGKNVTPYSIDISTPDLCYAGDELELNGKVLNKVNEQLDEDIEYELVNIIAGVSLVDGVITINNTVIDNTVITVVATCKDVSKEFTVTVKMDNNPTQLELILLSDPENIRSGNSVDLTAILKNTQGIVLIDTIVWSIKESVEGISIDNGVLTIAESFEGEKEITVVATYKNLTKELKVLVLGNSIADNLDNDSNINTALVVVGSVLMGLAVLGSLGFIIIRRVRKI